MNPPVEHCDASGVEAIARGRYTEACIAIGRANLATILAAEQWVSQEVSAAQAGGEPHRGYLGRLKLVRARRRRLQAEAHCQHRRPGAARATWRV